MDKIEMISFSILIDEVAEVRQLLENIVSLDEEVHKELSIGILPFLSSLSDGILKFLPKDVQREFPNIGEQEFQNIISSVRVSYKQYTDKKFNKATRKVLEIENRFYLQIIESYNLIQKLIIKLLGQHDLGVYYFKEIPYGNTNQYHIYMESILSILDKMDIPFFDNRAKTLFFEYSENLGKLINSANQKIIVKPSIQDNRIEDFEQRDFYLLDTKRRNFLTGSLPLETQLFLFNILCQNNFVLYIMPDVLKSNNYFYTRSLIQCYIVSVKALHLLSSKYDALFSNTQLGEISYILNRKEKVFHLGNDFRNNMFHYKISNAPPQIFKNPERFFEELIEFHSLQNFKEFQRLLMSELTMINDLINSFIN